jgi:hypothetical protein
MFAYAEPQGERRSQSRKPTPKVLPFDNPVQAQRSAGLETAKHTQNTVGVSLNKEW